MKQRCLVLGVCLPILVVAQKMNRNEFDVFAKGSLFLNKIDLESNLSDPVTKAVSTFGTSIGINYTRVTKQRILLSEVLNLVVSRTLLLLIIPFRQMDFSNHHPQRANIKSTKPFTMVV